MLADPFGHGICLIEFLGRGYDEIANTLGKNDPWRSFGIFSSTSPAFVDNKRDREPLR